MATNNRTSRAPKDFLTGLALKGELFSYLETLIAKSSVDQEPFSVILFDIDRFKKYNDKFGHLFGDKVLAYIASTLRLSAWGERVDFFRYGGDEFVIVLPGKTPEKAAALFSHFRHSTARRPFLLENQLLTITISAGISAYPRDAAVPTDLIRAADEAMYFSKHRGRNLTTLFGRIDAQKRVDRLVSVAIITFVTVGALALREEIILTASRAAEVVHISFSPIFSDRIIMKDGRIFRGKITRETDGGLVIGVKSGGIVRIYDLDKADVDKTLYGLMTSSKDIYRDYVKANPNPHSGE